MMIIERDTQTHTHTHSLERRLASHGDLGAISHVVPGRHGQTRLLLRPQTGHMHLRICSHVCRGDSLHPDCSRSKRSPSYGNNRNNVEADKTASAVLGGTAYLSFPTLSCLLPQRDIFMFHRNLLALADILYACIGFYVTQSKQSYHRSTCFACWGFIFYFFCLS